MLFYRFYWNVGNNGLKYRLMSKSLNLMDNNIHLTVINCLYLVEPKPYLMCYLYFRQRFGWLETVYSLEKQIMSRHSVRGVTHGTTSISTSYLFVSNKFLLQPLEIVKLVFISDDQMNCFLQTINLLLSIT